MSMRIAGALTWKLFLISSFGLALLAFSFHQNGWADFLGRPRGRQLPLAIIWVLCAGVWVFTLAALVFGKRVPRLPD